MISYCYFSPSTGFLANTCHQTELGAAVNAIFVISEGSVQPVPEAGISGVLSTLRYLSRGTGAIYPVSINRLPPS
jgi:hypothetical protein